MSEFKPMVKMQTTEPADPPAAGEPRAQVGPLPTVERSPARLQ